MVQPRPAGSRRMPLVPSAKPSIIEMSYRLQYSDIILQQVQDLNQRGRKVLNGNRREELAELEQLEDQYLRMIRNRQQLENDLLVRLEKSQASEMDPRQRELLVKLQREALEELQKQAQFERERWRDSLKGKVSPSYKTNGEDMPGRPEPLEDPNKIFFGMDDDYQAPETPEDTKQGLYGLMSHFDQVSETLIEDQLSQFGYDFFDHQGTAVPATAGLTLPEHYLIGPGDVLRVNVWGGGADVQFEGKVEAEGTIAIPKLGVIDVMGVRYGDLERLIGSELEKYVAGANLSVSVVRPRSVEVYVVGQVEQPGLTVVPAFSTVITALTRVGGPLKTGSLRNITIFRRGKAYRHLDLYEMMFKGNAQNDIFLEDKDLIQVPYIGSTIAVVGAVPRPGIYEILPGRTSTDQALSIAGGPTPQAMAKLYIRRFKNNRVLTVLDVDITEKQEYKGTKIRNGDLLEVRFASHQFSESIKIIGHVWDPIEYGYKRGMCLSQVIPKPDQLKPEAITEFFLLKRYVPELAEYRWHRVPLSQVWYGRYDTLLCPHDVIRVLSKEEYGISRPVLLRGAVWRPARYEFHHGMTIDDLIALGGGLKDGANLEAVQISRQKVVDQQAVTEHISLNLCERKEKLYLEPYDTVMVPMIKGRGDLMEIMIEGEVKFPGRYTIKEGERVSDLIARAGGLLPSAYIYGAQYFSSTAQKIQQRSINSMIQEIEVRMSSAAVGMAAYGGAEGVADAQAQRVGQEAFLKRLRNIKATGRVTIMLADMATFKGSKWDFKMENGDRLVIPTRPAFINVVGAVYAANAYLHQPELTIGQYMKMAGGPTKTADKSYIYVQKANGRVSSISQTGFFSKSFYSETLMPGDTIIVPEDLERVPKLRLVKEVSDIFYKIAITAGVAQNFFN